MCSMSVRVLAAIAVLGVAAPASGHLRLTSHEARYGDSQKSGPCGVAGGERTTDKVYIGKPGVEVMLVWDEFINHPGHFRIDFDMDGDDDFADPVLPCADETSVEDCFDTTNTGPFMQNGIADTQGGTSNFLYTLPAEECDNCTLQVIQAMYDKPPFVTPGNDIYYQCVDIILSNDGPDELTLIEVDGSDAGMGGDGDGDGNASSGCRVAGSGGGSTLALILIAGALGLRRRRR
jgi:MYXO-CTERM domain-containing protein